MHLLASRQLGLAVMVPFALLGAVILFCPGSLRFQKPQGGLISWLYNIANLLLMLAITPAVGVLLVKERADVLAVVQWFVVPTPTAYGIEAAGLAIYAAGIALLSWSRWRLGRSFRLGAVAPSEQDRLSTDGPYRLVRHPMYTGVLAQGLGLALVIQSLAVLLWTGGLLMFILLMVPAEERQLRQHYGKQYDRYCRRVKRLVPLLY